MTYHFTNVKHYDSFQNDKRNQAGCHKIKLLLTDGGDGGDGGDVGVVCAAPGEDLVSERRPADGGEEEAAAGGESGRTDGGSRQTPGSRSDVTVVTELNTAL